LDIDTIANEAAQKTTSFQVDDFVLVMDATAPRSTWKKGKVREVFVGKDQQVRSADVKTEDKLLRRPTSKLIIIIIIYCLDFLTLQVLKLIKYCASHNW